MQQQISEQQTAMDEIDPIDIQQLKEMRENKANNLRAQLWKGQLTQETLLKVMESDTLDMEELSRSIQSKVEPSSL